MKIFFADKFEQIGLDKLKEMGCEMVFKPDTSADTLPDEIKSNNPDVVVVRSTKVQEAALKASDNLKLIIRAGAGYDTIDTATARSLNIDVANCPGKNATAVAEVAFGLILACDRRIPDATRDLRAGKWRKKEYQKAKGLYGRTIGVVGKGEIAKSLMRMAKGFGMDIVAWSRSMNDEVAKELGIRAAKDLYDLAEQSDVVSVHLASNAGTKGIIDSKFFDAMKEGAYFINTARGAVVDYAALKKAVESKGIRAGLDVFADEPGSGDAEFSDEILNVAGVYGTPHIGASTDQAQVATALEAVRIVDELMNNGKPVNIVN